VILIPVWFLLAEIGILEGMLIYIYVRNRASTMGWVAGFLAIPIAYVWITYAITPFVPIEAARILARYAFAVLFFTLIILFGRYIWGLRK